MTAAEGADAADGPLDPRLVAGLRLAAGALLAAALASSTQFGLDAEKYLRWTDAGLAGDIEQLAGSQARSTNGIPFFHWSAGPGLLFAPFVAAARAVGLSHYVAVKTAGFLFAAGFWATFFRAARFLCGRRRAVFVTATTFLATPLGYYSRTISSETLSLLPIGLLAVEACRGYRGLTVRPAVVGVAAGLLLLVRPYLAVYAAPAGVAFLLNAKPRAATFRGFAAMAAPVIVGLIQVMTVHIWMTGDPLRSPYAFGDEGFRSLDLIGAPHVDSVLFDIGFGVVPLHPLVGFGAILLAWGGIVSAIRGRRRAAIAFAAFLAVAVNVWFQGSYYYWWLSPTSFGMRGLLLAAVPATLAFAAWSRRTPDPLAAAVASACGLWGFSALMQGPIHYGNVADFLEGQFRQLADVATGPGGAQVLVGTLLAATVLGPKKPTGLITAFFAGLIWAYAASRGDGKIYAPLCLGLAAIAAATRFRPRITSRVIPALPAVGAAAAFAVALALFVRLAASTETRATEGFVDFLEQDVRAAAHYLINNPRPELREQAAPIAAFLERRTGVDIAPDEEPGPPITYDLLESVRDYRAGFPD